MSFNLTKNELIQKFQLNAPVPYHTESLKRLSHLNSASLRKASVLIGVVEREHGLNIIFTKRARHLKHHPGQISFPGGKFELNDKDLANTALRETYEETGITSNQIQLIGKMPELPTVSQFSVTPFIGFIEPRYTTQIDQNEVEEIFEVPLSIVMNPVNLKSQTFLIRNHSHRVFALNYQHHFIWGMTAQIIQALQQHILSH